jgi:hypothetical protein
MNKITLTLLDGSTQEIFLSGQSKAGKARIIETYENLLANGNFIMMQVS